MFIQSQVLVGGDHRILLGISCELKPLILMYSRSYHSVPCKVVACILPRSITRTVSARAPHQCAGLWNHACHLGQVSKHVLPCCNKNLKIAGPGRSPYQFEPTDTIVGDQPQCHYPMNGSGPSLSFLPNSQPYSALDAGCVEIVSPPRLDVSPRTTSGGFSLCCPHEDRSRSKNKSGGEGWTRTNRPSWWSQTETTGSFAT